MMKVRECMSGQPMTVQASEPLQKAAMVMGKCDVGAVPIMLQDNLVGILTDRDIVIKGIAGGLDVNNHLVQEIMSPKPLTITADTEVEEAAELMSKAKVRRLPVLEDGKLVGLVSLGDLVVAHKDHHDETCARVLERLSEPIGPKCAM